MLNSILTSPITFTGLAVCIGCAIIMGILSALVFSFRQHSSSSFLMTLTLLPVAMCMIVIMINGNLGVAVAVAGGFTLVRFRSIAGNGREISGIFSVMTLGVILGMGYIAIAALFFLVISLTVLILTLIGFGERRNNKILKITIPENYDYGSIFDDIFKKYSVKSRIKKIKTTNLGSLIEVTYSIILPSDEFPKAMLDDLRTKNSNLRIIVSEDEMESDSL